MQTDETGQMPDVVTVGSLIVEVTPTAPGETLAEAHAYTLVAGGAAANAVFAMARLGVRVRFIAAVGADEFGQLAINELRDFGVETGSVRRIDGQLTPASFCAIDGRGGKQFRFYRFPGYSSPMQALTADDFRVATRCRLFDFSEGSIRDPAQRTLVFQAARDARAAGVLVLYAMNLRRGAWGMDDDAIRAVEREACALADIVLLNEEEAELIAGAIEPLQRIQAWGPRAVVLTRGGDGDMTVRAGDQETSAPPFRVPVIYDVGAGDTFHAALVAAILRHPDPLAMPTKAWADALRFAAATAAIRVSTSADPRDLPTRAQVEAWLEERGK